MLCWSSSMEQQLFHFVCSQCSVRSSQHKDIRLFESSAALSVLGGGASIQIFTARSRNKVTLNINIQQWDQVIVLQVTGVMISWSQITSVSSSSSSSPLHYLLIAQECFSHFLFLLLHSLLWNSILPFLISGYYSIAFSMQSFLNHVFVVFPVIKIISKVFYHFPGVFEEKQTIRSSHVLLLLSGLYWWILAQEQTKTILFYFAVQLSHLLWT